MLLNTNNKKKSLYFIDEYFKDNTIVMSCIGSEITKLTNTFFSITKSVETSRKITSDIVYNIIHSGGKDIFEIIKKLPLHEKEKLPVKDDIKSLSLILMFGKNDFIENDLKRFGLTDDIKSVMNVQNIVKEQANCGAEIFCFRFLDEEYSKRNYEATHSPLIKSKSQIDFSHNK